MSSGGPGGFGGGYGAPPGGYGAPPGGYGGAPPGGYGPPPGGFTPPPGGYGPPPGSGGGGPAQGFGALDPLSFGWEAAKLNFVELVLPIAVSALVAGIINGIVGAVIGALGVGAIVALELEAEQANLVSNLMRIPASVVGNLITLFFTAGMVAFALRVARGEKPEFVAVFTGGRFYLPMLIAGVVSGIATSIGLLLCIIPGVIIALGLSLTNFIIADRNMNPIDALKESWRMTSGHKMNLFIYAVVVFVLSFVGVCLCVLPSFAVQAIAMVGSAFIYLKLNGETPRLHGGASY